MTLPIFPSSPVWANLTREPIWSEEVYHYDSGLRQGASPWSQPLMRYTVNAQNFNELKQSSLFTFMNTLKMRSSAFLFKDPYDYKANGVVQPTSTNMSSGDGFYLMEANSYRILPDSANFLLRDPRSGNLVSTSHYVMSLDNGWVQALVAVSSVWVCSMEFFRKCAFETQYVELSRVWNNFNFGGLVIQEILPNDG